MTEINRSGTNSDRSASTLRVRRQSFLRQRALPVLFKYKVRFVVVLALGFFAAFTLSRGKDQAWESQARVRVEGNLAGIVAAKTALAAGAPMKIASSTGGRSLEFRILSQRSFRLELVRELQRTGVPALLKEGLHISHDAPGSSFIVRYRHLSGQAPQRVLEALLVVYERKLTELYDLSPTIQRLEKDLLDGKEEHRKALADLASLKKVNGVTDVESAHRGLQKEMAALRRARQESGTALMQASVRADQLTRAMSLVPAKITTRGEERSNPSHAKLMSQRDSIRLQMIGNEYLPGTTQYEALLERLAFVDQRLKVTPKLLKTPPQTRINPTFQKLVDRSRAANIVAATETRISIELESKMRALSMELERLQDLSVPFATLSRRAERAEQRLASLIGACEEGRRVKRLLDVESGAALTILDAPSVPLAIAGGGREQRILFGGALALISTLVLVLGVAFFDRSIHGAVELETATACQVLATFPDVNRKRALRSHRSKQPVSAPPEVDNHPTPKENSGGLFARAMEKHEGQPAAPVKGDREATPTSQQFSRAHHNELFSRLRDEHAAPDGPQEDAPTPEEVPEVSQRSTRRPEAAAPTRHLRVADFCGDGLERQLDRMIYALGLEKGRGDDGKTRQVVLMGVMPGEGTTAVASGLARRLVHAGPKRVLLVDCSTPQPTADGKARKARRSERSRGESGQSGIVRPYAVPGVDMVSLPLSDGDRDGTTPGGLQELMMDRIGHEYDVVIYDAGAVAPRVHALGFLRAGITALLVVRAEWTALPLVRDTAHLIHATSAGLRGVIFNRRR